jgi:hypothetical protein
VTDNTATLVMKELVLGATATVLVPAAKKQDGKENNNNASNKKQSTSTAAVNTVSGADGTTALH